MLSVLLGVQLLTREVDVGERQVHTIPQASPGSPAVAFPVTEEESSRRLIFMAQQLRAPWGGEAAAVGRRVWL